MSITSSLHTGASGVKSHAEAMRVISDNIANVNTIGFKSGRANFQDVLGSNIANAGAGSGSRIGSVQQSFSQGALMATGNTTDMALRGDGFFVLNGSLDGISGDYFSRDGTFEVDPDGYIVHSTGLRVQGYPADPRGEVSNSVSDIKLETNALAPTSTTSIEIVANLDANTEVSATPFSLTEPAETSDFSTSITTFDSLGRPHQLEMFFKRVPTTGAEASRWEAHVLASDEELGGAGPGFQELTTVELTFNTNGSLIDFAPPTVTANWAGSDPMEVTLNLGETNGGIDGITTYAAPSTAQHLAQDGYSSGDLAGIKIDEQGRVRGLFSNGQERMMGQIALATFGNNHGLERKGAGMFASGVDSGLAAIGKPTQGGRATVVAGSLEGSNVDLADQFVEMITVQRGFQGNSKTITTADELLNTVMQLKR